jgi:hypothetical protein
MGPKVVLEILAEENLPYPVDNRTVTWLSFPLYSQLMNVGLRHPSSECRGNLFSNEGLVTKTQEFDVPSMCLHTQ